MHVDTSTICRNGKKYTRHLIRQCYYENGKIKMRTIANISACSPAEIAAIKLAFKNKHNLNQLSTKKVEWETTQGLSFGAVWLLFNFAKKLGIVKALGNSRNGKLALWQIIARIINQGSRLSSVRLAREHNVEDILGLRHFTEDDLYQNLDWLAQEQTKIEDRLFKQLGKEKTQLFLYDVTSSYFEGTCNELAAFGYNRDGKKGKMQIVIGLLCDEKGDPLSIEVFEGNTTDPKTVATQIKKVSQRFGADKVTFVGDRGMIKSAQIAELNAQDFHYITTITKPQIESLLIQGEIQLSLFDEELSEITTDDGIRYILRRNPIRASEIKKSRENKLNALRKRIFVKNEYLAKHKRAKIDIALRDVKNYAAKLRIDGWIIFKNNKRIIDFEIDKNKLQEKEKLDGCYVLKTDLNKEIAKETIHERYKDLALVERAFRTSKTVFLELRPIYVRLASRTKGHAFVIMLAYKIIKELTKCWIKLDLTVEEGIENLTTLCTMEVKINENVFCNQIPKPNQLLQQLFKEAEVDLPTVLPKTKKRGEQKKINTTKKLPTERKIV